MKKKRQFGQAAPKKIIPEKKRYEFFCSKEQVVGFIFFSLVLFAVGWISYSLFRWMNDPERVVLSKLTVTGHRQFTTDRDIQQAIMTLGFPNTFIDQDIDVIQQEILRLPWIKQASVRKQWPDKLSVYIIEYTPVAYWNDAYLLDKNAAVFNIGDKQLLMTLPKLYGPENTEKNVMAMYKHVRQILRWLPDPMVITSLKVNERYSWSMTTGTFFSHKKEDQKSLISSTRIIKIILGRKQFNEKLKRFMLLYPTIKKHTEMNEDLTIIDLRYNNGASVQQHKLSKLAG